MWESGFAFTWRSLVTPPVPVYVYGSGDASEGVVAPALHVFLCSTPPALVELLLPSAHIVATLNSGSKSVGSVSFTLYGRSASMAERNGKKGGQVGRVVSGKQVHYSVKQVG